MKLGIVLTIFLLFSTLFVRAEEVTNDTATPVVQATEKSEDQIPVDFSKVKKAETNEASTGRLFLTFGLMAVVLGLGFYFAKRHGRPANSQQTKIKVLTQHYLGPKKSLAIVHVAGESVLIGITEHSINLIKSLALIDDEVPENISSASFEKTFNEKKEIAVGPTQAGPTTGEEFSIRHIKDVVSLKLKGMRNDL